MWLAHPVYGDVVSIGISALRQRDLARSLAEVIEATGARRRQDTLLVASWRLVGGGGSAELLLSGAIAARARHDQALTERLARAAIDEGAGFEARFLAAEAAHVQGRPDQAEHELAALAPHAASDAERARVALLRFDNGFFLQGRADLRLIDDAADAISDSVWHDELLSRRFFATSMNSGPRATLEAAPTVLQRPSSGPLAAAHLMIADSLVRIGRLDDAIQLLTPPHASGEAPESDAPWDQWSLYGARVPALIYQGRLGEAEELLSRAYRQLADQGPTHARALVTGWSAVLHLEQGRLMSASRLAGESYTVFRELGRAYAARWPYVTAAHALALAGQADRATETLAALDALGVPTDLLTQTELLQARAWTAAATGDLPAARDQLEAAADLGEEIGDLIGASSALHDLVRLGRARDVAARLTALADQVDGDLVATRAAYANALAARDSDALGKVAQDFEDLGAILYAAEARAEAAVLLRQAGDPRHGAAAEQHAARLLARCEGAATPPVQTLTARVHLTPGELDTARQAAAGRTNKQIAGDLHLSVRTIESHLQRAYEKLGVSGRHELAEALRDQPTT